MTVSLNLNKQIKNSFLLLVVFFLIFLFSFVSAPQKAEAIYVPVFDQQVWLLLQGQLSTLNANRTAALTRQIQYEEAFCQKEIGPFCVQIPLVTWDSVAQIAAQAIGQNLVNDVLGWINTNQFGPLLGSTAAGFGQNEAFVRDVEGFFLDVQDTVAEGLGDQIIGNIASLCNFNPATNFARVTQLSNSVRQATRVNYSSKFDAKLDCSNFTTLSGGATIPGFMGDFNNGGWDAFLTTALVPQHNPSGQLLLGQAELNAQLKENEEKESQKLAWGDGFFSKEVGGIIQSPASAIRDQVTNSIGSEVTNFLNSDELTEIILGFMTNLFNSTLKAGL